MIHLARRLALADLRSAPGRTAAVAVLLAVAAWLPHLSVGDPSYGVALAAAVAFCATLGALALEEDRSRLLERNGARPVALALVATAAMVPAAVLAAVVAVAAGAVAAGPSVRQVLGTTLLVPVASAPVAAWVARLTTAAGEQRPTDGGPVQGSAKLLGNLATVAVVLVQQPLAVAFVALRLTVGAWSTSPARRATGAVLALVVAVAAALLVGASSTWTDLSVALLWMGPGLLLALVVLGMHAVALGAGAAAHLGPRARLALAPLVGRRRALAPLVGVVALVTALAVSQAVVGASFGEREANRERDLPTVRAAAGTGPDQAIAVVRPVDPAALRAIAAEASGPAVRAVVVEQLGPDLSGFFEGLSPFAGSRTPIPGSTVRIAPVPGDDAGTRGARPSRWIGIVAPEDLAALGWSEAAGPLAEGKVVLLGRGAVGGQVTVDSLEGSTLHPASGIAAPTGLLLPGALVAREAAPGIAGSATSRVVVVPVPGAEPPPTQGDLLAVASSIQEQAAALPPFDPGGLDATEQDLWELSRSLGVAPDRHLLVTGDTRLVLYRSGPLNELPAFARTAEDGQGRLLGLAVVATLMTVAGVLLALGATRTDDVVLEVQGAPGRIRAAVSAIQAGVIAGSAAAFGALAGIGVPAAAMALYNGREHDLPDIPLVVPGLTWVVLGAIVLLAVAISAAGPVARRPAGPERLVALGA